MDETTWSIVNGWRSIDWKRWMPAVILATVGLTVFQVAFGVTIWHINGRDLFPDLDESYQKIIGWVLWFVFNISFYGLIYGIFLSWTQSWSPLVKSIILGLCFGMLSVLVMPWNDPLDYANAAIRTGSYVVYLYIMARMYRPKFGPAAAGAAPG